MAPSNSCVAAGQQANLLRSRAFGHALSVEICQFKQPCEVRFAVQCQAGGMPEPKGIDLQFAERATPGEKQRAEVRSSERKVANHRRHAGDPNDLTGWSDHPDTAGADAKHSTLGVDFHAVGDAGFRRGHIAEHAVVAERSVRGRVERTDAPVIGAIAHDETALAIQGAAVPLAGLFSPDHHRAVRLPAQAVPPLDRQR